MIRVLQISICDDFRGVEKQELELFKNMYNYIKFDFLTPNDNTFKEYKDEILSLGGNLYNFNLKRNNLKNKLKYGRELRKFLKSNKYDVIHINTSAFMFSFHTALIAKSCKVKKVIVHSHSVRKVNVFKRLIKKILNPIYMHITDEQLSCSKEACSLLYNKKYYNKIKIVHNGIEVNKYKYNIKYRDEYRDKLNIKDNIVYGHIGSFDERKNQLFLIDIFYEIQKIQDNSILVLVWTGPLKDKVEKRVKELNISDKVIFLGFVTDVYKILNAIDVFIFPSIYEGFGISLVESQANGLITYCSNNITSEVNISPFFRKFNLSENPKDIANRICKEKIDINKRSKAYKHIIKKGYDINTSCKLLKDIYLN